MSPRLNVTPCCCLQLEKANELLSEEEVWYVLSEMAQVKFFLRASFQCACVCAVPQQCLLSMHYLPVWRSNACSLVLTYDLALLAGTPFSTCKWSLAS